MATNPYHLYRFTHADGSAKDWAYAALGQGQAEMRWGPAHRLIHGQIKPLSIARQRAVQKLRKGYLALGLVWLNDHGERIHPPC